MVLLIPSEALALELRRFDTPFDLDAGGYLEPSNWNWDSSNRTVSKVVLVVFQKAFKTTKKVLKKEQWCQKARKTT